MGSGYSPEPAPPQPPLAGPPERSIRLPDARFPTASVCHTVVP